MSRILDFQGFLGGAGKRGARRRENLLAQQDEAEAALDLPYLIPPPLRLTSPMLKSEAWDGRVNLGSTRRPGANWYLGHRLLFTNLLAVRLLEDLERWWHDAR